MTPLVRATTPLQVSGVIPYLLGFQPSADDLITCGIEASPGDSERRCVWLDMPARGQVGGHGPGRERPHHGGVTG
jgi:hypothetical protein